MGDAFESWSYQPPAEVRCVCCDSLVSDIGMQRKVMHLLRNSLGNPTEWAVSCFYMPSWYE